MSKKYDRKALVSAVKDMNKTLGLNPKIFTKVGDEPVKEEVLIDALTKAARGYDEESGKYVKDDAVSREKDALSDETWAVLKQIGALPSKKSEKSEKKTDKKPAKEGVEKKKLGDGEGKLKVSPTRTAGRIPQDFKGLKADLEASGKDAAISRKFDKILLTKQTLGEHIKEADKLGSSLKMVHHIRYRFENCGYDFLDKRKFQTDEDGIVQLIGLTPNITVANHREMDLPHSASSGKKAAKEEKTEKKSGKDKKLAKEEKSEKSEKKADKKNKKAKK